MSEITFKIEESLYDVVDNPAPAKKLVPDWYKKMSVHISDASKMPVMPNQESGANLSIKACIPIQDELVSGYIITMPQDLYIFKDGSEMFTRWSDEESLLIESHSVEQFKSSPLEKFSIGGVLFKFINPWRIYTKKGYSIKFFPPSYHDLDFEVLPGIVDTDLMHSVNFPFIWKGGDGEFIIQRGTPLVQLLPFKREKWVSNFCIQTEKEEIKQRRGFASKLAYWYRDFAHSKKHYQ
ncbi:hypothetical protein OAA38_00710 [bacterium]|nr:hypothetical protein [bacterium]